MNKKSVLLWTLRVFGVISIAFILSLSTALYLNQKMWGYPWSRPSPLIDVKWFSHPFSFGVFSSLRSKKLELEPRSKTLQSLEEFQKNQLILTTSSEPTDAVQLFLKFLIPKSAFSRNPSVDALMESFPGITWGSQLTLSERVLPLLESRLKQITFHKKPAGSYEQGANPAYVFAAVSQRSGRPSVYFALFSGQISNDHYILYEELLETTSDIGVVLRVLKQRETYFDVAGSEGFEGWIVFFLVFIYCLPLLLCCWLAYHAIRLFLKYSLFNRHPCS